MAPRPIFSKGFAGGSIDRRPRTPLKQQESLLVDPLEPFSKSRDPGFRDIADTCDFRECCSLLACREQLLKERVKATSASSDASLRYINLRSAKKYVTDRAALLDDLSVHNQECIVVLNSLAPLDSMERSIFDRILDHVREFQSLVFDEQKKIARGQSRLELRMLYHPAPARIGQAYLTALAHVSTRPGLKTSKGRFRCPGTGNLP